VTVALNGDGGDESFAGYTRYVANRLAGRLGAVPLTLRRGLAGAGRRMAGDRWSAGRETTLANKAGRLLRALPLEPAERYAGYVSLFDAGRRELLYTDEFRALVGESTAGEVIAEPWRHASGGDVIDVMLEVDACTYLPDDLIAKIDIATMAHALEARSPLLDHELMEFAARIPAAMKVRGGQKKWILREALRGWLPGDILDRPKQGFSVPVGDWFRNELRAHVNEVLLDPAALARGYFRPGAVHEMLNRQAAGADTESKRVWALYMLELWHREFIDRRAAVAAPDDEPRALISAASGEPL
jgi:asparagine synthase (glutamine-hydrolysing)